MATWTMEAEYIQSCNCAYGCPCNFNALPDKGGCHALIAHHVRTGAFNGTRLDGVTIAWGLWWPKAIHEGNGVSRLYIDNANEAQRKAIAEIWGGKVGGGVFQIFNSTFTKVLPARDSKIDWRFHGPKSGFTVQGVGGVETDSIRNPVTGAEWRGHLAIDSGLNFKKALVVGVKKLSLHDQDELDFEYENTAGFVTVTKYTEKGPHESTLP